MFETLEALRLAVKDLAADPVDVGLGTALGEQILELERIAAALDAERLRRLAAFDRAGIAAADGSATTTGWLRAKAHLAPGEAAGRVRAARALDESLPATAAALAAGELTYGHVRVAVAATAGIDLARVAEGEPLLLSVARRLDVSQFQVAARVWRARVQAELARADEDFAEAAREFHASTTLGGMVRVDGLLDPLNGETFLTALRPLAARRGPEDERTPGQRNADALGEMARIVLDSGTLPDSGGEKPHINVIISAETLAGDDVAGMIRADWSDALFKRHLEQLCCDAALVRIVMKGQSEVLDVGRATRIIPPSVRRALIARSGGRCEFPGCTRPHRWCEGHHLIYWENGGETNLANLALLCLFHHHLMHRGWSLRRNPNGSWTTTRPDHTTITGDPPHRDGPLALIN